MKIEIGYTANNEYFKTNLPESPDATDPDRFWICTYTKESYSVGQDEAVWHDPPTQLHGLPVLVMSRGGAWTWHGPGQVAVIMELNCNRILQQSRPRLAQKMRFVTAIGQHITQILRKLCSIDCWYNSKDPGIYTQEGAKLCSMGWHSISDTTILLNWSFNVGVPNNFAGFGKIDVCGVRDRPMANLMSGCGSWQTLQYAQFGKIVVDALVSRIYNNMDLEIGQIQEIGDDTSC